MAVICVVPVALLVSADTVTAAASPVPEVLRRPVPGTAGGPGCSALHSARDVLHRAPVRVEREALLMGTRLRVRVDAPDRAAGVAAAEAAFAAVRRVDSLLSTWRQGTELSRLNSAPVGQATAVSPALAELLGETAFWSRETRGAFHPAVGSLIDAWDLRGEGRLPTDDELDAALARAGDGAFADLDESGRWVRRVAGAWMDAGAFGKGAALRAAGAALRAAEIEGGTLDFGGQLLVLDGSGTGSAPRVVAVAHPSDRSRPAACLTLGAGSISTSGASERFVLVDGRRLAHVLDPRTGRPVDAWGSATVLAADPLVADIVSTALLVMGPDAALEWARDRADVGVLLLVDEEEGVRKLWNAAMADHLSWTDRRTITQSSTTRRTSSINHRKERITP